MNSVVLSAEAGAPSGACRAEQSQREAEGRMTDILDESTKDAIVAVGDGRGFLV